MSDKARRGSSKYETWLTKSDEWLAEVLQRGDPQDIDLALQILHDRYQAKLERRLIGKFPEDWVETVIQNIWISFYNEVKVKGITKQVSSLLGKIAKRREIDAIRQRQAERRIENDIPINWGDDEDGLQIEVLDEPFEEQIDKRVQLRFLRQIPFIDSVLSDCERVLWILREQLGYPSITVGRLTGKQSYTVHSALYTARKKAKEFIESEEYELSLATQELRGLISSPSLQSGSLVVERFSNCITPHLTPDEIKPLGMTNEELQANYAASLLLPWEPDQDDEMGGPSLILTRKTDWTKMQDTFKRLRKNRTETEYLSPEECLLKIDRDNENIILTVEQMLEFLLESDALVKT